MELDQDKYSEFLDYIGCGSGWNHLLISVFDFILDYNFKVENLQNRIELFQVKEKFGLLRIYVNHEPEELTELIKRAENISEVTCDRCSKQGKMYTFRGWLSVGCPEHTRG